jgi:outer membrane protein OmpA-like peptidoglycan-associated protein
MSSVPRLLVLLALALPGTVRADEPITVDLVAKGQQGSSWPVLVLRGHQPIDQFNLGLACGKAKVQRSGTLGSGERLEIPLEVPLGRTTCKGSLVATFGEDEGEMPLSFEVALLPPMQISVPRERLDLAAGTLVLTADRAVAQVEIEAYGETGAMIGHGSTQVGGLAAGTSLEASWSASPGDVLHLHVQAQDTDGFWAGVDLFPWSYNIPHEDVVFDTARWEILPQEEPKLQAALDQARDVLRRFSATPVAMNLYVGGYTDTVGDPGYNQGLSEHRAQAIAGWFQAHGFERPIHYQGFGEGALAVQTPDETDEQANRRANYVIAAETPPFCAEFPRTAWRRLD